METSRWSRKQVVIPAKAGIRPSLMFGWTPACAGVTESGLPTIGYAALAEAGLAHAARYSIAACTPPFL